MIRATISITKSFDDSTEFTKLLESNDFEEFFKDEGKYLDNLAETLESKGKINDSYEVIYKVIAKKESI